MFNQFLLSVLDLEEKMASDEVKVIGAWASPFVMRPRIALNLKSVPYEFVQETFGAKSELLLKSNPVHKKIPVLIHADKPVCETNIIVEYVDETWSASGPSMLPSTPYDRAIARFWEAYVDEKVPPLLPDPQVLLIVSCHEIIVCFLCDDIEHE